MHSSLPIISVLVGLALLLFGRRLFWLFVAALGFAIGLQLAPYLSQNPPLWLSLLLSLGLGLLGALLAVVLQKLAIAIAGFLGGALGEPCPLFDYHFHRRRNHWRTPARRPF